LGVRVITSPRETIDSYVKKHDERFQTEILKVNRKVEKVERLRLRWMEVVKNDLRELKVKTWRLKANSREEWASVEKEGKVL
jgi:hypothetical protein